MRKHQSARITINASAQQTIVMDVCQRPGIEACGVFIGYMDEQGNWFVEEAQPLRNIYNSPVYFEFAPEDLLQAELTASGRIIGVYHSHPTGFAEASTTDRNNMQRVNQEQEIPWVWLIISGPFDAEFQERVRGNLKNAAIIAYHHYLEGLRTITIHLENDTSDASIERRIGK
ncbi:MAG TPA: Mov34/MPN/PAD-1 family protein [Ktedonobacteraceae bacterium]|nr:Mov34/MPN/PAD-1 family protein [Ktedonobacteraceae bacterium]